jgi:hypothetical protein
LSFLDRCAKRCSHHVAVGTSEAALPSRQAVIDQPAPLSAANNG